MDDTICAVATPLGEGGIGIVRISGAEAVAVAARIVRVKSGTPLQDLASHTLHYASFSSVQNDTEEDVDDGLVVVMRAPRSYTGEDVVELHCHGGPVVLTTICQVLVEAGARLAAPGEFTKRAFLNGKMDLTQAEAVMDVIHAHSERGLRMAQAQRRGRLGEALDDLRERLMRLLAELEAGIDFSEEDIEFIGREELIKGIGEVRVAVARLLQSGARGRILREGASVALVGRPNVGKSSLMNALLATDRAIVTAIPGTTRDVLEEMVNLDGVAVRLQDTAGLRTAEDPVEREGIRRTETTIEDADVVVILIDGSSRLLDEDCLLLGRCREKKCLVVVNKVDLQPRLSDEDRDKLGLGTLEVSAKTGEGLDKLRTRIRELLVGGDGESSDGVLITRVRHEIALQTVGASLEKAMKSVGARLPAEIIAVDLRDAVEALGEITGAVTTDDILDRIFSQFCIGK